VNVRLVNGHGLKGEGDVLMLMSEASMRKNMQVHSIILQVLTRDEGTPTDGTLGLGLGLGFRG
jgi:di/tripeptidase